MDQYQNPLDCGSPNKNQNDCSVQNVGNSYGQSNVQNNAQNDIGFDKSYGQQGKRYVCRNCGTVHRSDSAPKNCCKCDCCDFKEM